MLAGLVAAALPPASTVIAGGVILATTLASAGVGAWLSGMVGMSVDNRQLKEFEDAIEAGELLILADVSTDRVNEIEASVKNIYLKWKLKAQNHKYLHFPDQSYLMSTSI